MRKLMWTVIGFAAGMIPWAYLTWWKNWLLPVAGVFLVGAIVLCFLKKRELIAIILLLFGMTFSQLWAWGYDYFGLSPARKLDGKTVSATIELSDYSKTTNYGSSADGYMHLGKEIYRVQVYWNETEPLKPGDYLGGDFLLYFAAIGGEKEPTYHQGRGVFLRAYAQEGARAFSCDEIPRQYFPAILRKNILDTITEMFPADTVGFARALLLGDSTMLSYEEDTAFKISGIRHVIAVSGLHVSILFSLVYHLCAKRRILTALLGIPVLFLFAAVAGFTPSIMRACIMQSLMILSLLLNKDYDPPTALSFAVLVLLLVNPLSITSVSFQLSVGCMIGIFLFSTRISDYIMRLLRCPKKRTLRSRICSWFAGSISVTLSAMSITTPLCVLYFRTVSISGIVTNMLTLWVVSFIFYGIMAACALGAIWPTVGAAIAWVISWAIRYVLSVSKWISSWPFSAVYTCSPYILIWLVLCYGLLVVLLLCKKRRAILTAICILTGLALAICASALEARLVGFRVTVIDVGQGQAVLLQSGGKNYLVDCGGDSDRIAADKVSECLLSQGIKRLDGLILTHFDQDHSGGVQYLLTRVETDVLYLPDIPDDSGMKLILSHRYSDCTQWVTEDFRLSGDWGSIALLPSSEDLNENESSLCILFQADNCDILIMGDRGIAGEDALIGDCVLPELELLVAGHHGAATSTGYRLLNETRPAAVAISAGEGNRYGHPSPEMLQRLEDFGCRILRTDQKGTIIFGR